MEQVHVFEVELIDADSRTAEILPPLLLGWRLALHPHVRIDQAGMRFAKSLRRTDAPWAAIAAVEYSESLTLALWDGRRVVGSIYGPSLAA